MKYETTISIVMRKKGFTYAAAATLLQGMEKDGILMRSYESRPFGEKGRLDLDFIVQTKYGRNLFYPACEHSEFILKQLLHQKTATKAQILLMQTHGWNVNIKQNPPI